jgi:integrase/recombinase XerD
MPDSKKSINDMFDILRGHAYYDYSALRMSAYINIDEERSAAMKVRNKDLPALSEVDLEDLAKFRKWMEHKKYGESTVNSYLSMVSRFLRFIKPLNAEGGTAKEIRYVNEYIIPSHLSYTFQNQTVSAMKLFFSEIYDMPLVVEKLDRPRGEHRLPNVLSKDEIKSILAAPVNLKHRSLLSLIYACGLRRSEILNLSVDDIDSSRGVVCIMQSKGKKDRLVPIVQRVWRVF